MNTPWRRYQAIGRLSAKRKAMIAIVIVLLSIGLTACCFQLESDYPADIYIVHEIRVSASGEIAAPIELLRVEGDEAFPYVTLQPSAALSASASACTFDLEYVCISDSNGTQANIQTSYKYIVARDGAAPAQLVSIPNEYELELDPFDPTRGIIIDSTYPDALRRYRFSTTPTIGSERISYSTVTGDNRDPCGIWALPSSGYLALAHDYRFDCIVAAFLDDEFVVTYTCIVAVGKPDTIVGIAADGKALILAKTGDSVFRPFLLEKGAPPVTMPLVSLPVELASSTATWAGDRFWFRSSATVASFGLDGSLSEVCTVSTADAQDPLFILVGMDDGGIAFVGPADPVRLYPYSGPIPLERELRVVRYDSNLTAMCSATIVMDLPTGWDENTAQSLSIAEDDASGDLSILVATCSHGSTEIWWGSR